ADGREAGLLLDDEAAAGAERAALGAVVPRLGVAEGRVEGEEERGAARETTDGVGRARGGAVLGLRAVADRLARRAPEGVVVVEPLDPRHVLEAGAGEDGVGEGVEGVRVGEGAAVVHADLLVPCPAAAGARAAAEGEEALLGERERREREVGGALGEPLRPAEVEREGAAPAPRLREADAGGARDRKS